MKTPREHEDEHEHFGAIGADVSHPIAACDADLASKPVRRVRDPLSELRVSDARASEMNGSMMRNSSLP